MDGLRAHHVVVAVQNVAAVVTDHRIDTLSARVGRRSFDPMNLQILFRCEQEGLRA